MTTIQPADTDLWTMLSAAAGRHPDQSAIIESTATGHERLDFAGLLLRAERWAAELGRRGTRRGDVIALWLPNVLDWLPLQFAAARLGAVVIGINTRYGPHEVAHLLQAASPRVLVVPSVFIAVDLHDRLGQAVAELRGNDGGHSWNPPAVVAIGTTAGHRVDHDWDIGGGVAFAEGHQLPATDESESDAAPELPVNLFTTSGSTGAPKLAAHDQFSVARHSRLIAERTGIGPGDATLGVMPLCGVFAFNPAMAALSAGAAVIQQPVFNGARAVADVDRFGVTHLFGGDDLLTKLIAAAEEGHGSMHSVRRGGVGNHIGRAAEVSAWFAHRTGAAVTGVYGSSEIFALAAIGTDDLPLDIRHRGGGQLTDSDSQVHIFDLDTGATLGPDEAGEIRFKGSSVTSGYWNDPVRSKDVFDDQGWLKTGDLGYLTDDGTLVYKARLGESLRLRGFLVEVAEIEQFILQLPAVRDVKVVGVAGPDGDQAVAFLTAAGDGLDGLDVDAVSAHCREHLAPFKVPTRFIVLPELPTVVGTNGDKILVSRLRELATQGVLS